jgi:heme/copper-type cytochrome/quinol oxidase subunit 3
MILASVRPHSWDVPLFLHVAGAMVLVASVATVVTLLVLSRRGDTVALIRLAFRTLLFAALPSFVVMRAAAEWIFDKENLPDDLDWTGIGFGVSDFGLVILLVGTLLCGLAVRRLRRTDGQPGALVSVATVLIALTLVGYGVAIWAMTTKPGA